MTGDYSERIKLGSEQWLRGQLMKTILIETVTNGWIVRPFSPGCDWAQGEKSSIAVFTKIEDLQSAIPILLADEFVQPTQ